MLSELSEDIKELLFTDEDLECLLDTKNLNDYIEEEKDNASGYQTHFI